MDVSTGVLEVGRCPVCGEPVPEPLVCPECHAHHHRDCFDYNRGCATYACPRGPSWRTTPGPEEGAEPTGKILLTHLRCGVYDGVWYVPPIAACLTIALELIGLVGPLLGVVWLAWALPMMLLTIGWIAVSAERYYLDLDGRAVTKAKSVGGRDLFEWKVLPLAWVSRLALVPIEGADSGRFVLAAVDRSDRVLPLAPPMQRGTPAFVEARNLLARLKANSVFPVEVPAAALVGAPTHLLEVLDGAGAATSGGEPFEIVGSAGTAPVGRKATP